MIALLQRDLILAIRAGGGFGLGMAFFLMHFQQSQIGIQPGDLFHDVNVEIGRASCRERV